MSETLRRPAVFVLAAAAVIACNSNAPAEQPETSEQAQVADIDHMIRRGDGTFDVYCVDGTVERNVPASKIVANDVCNASSCPRPAPSATPTWNPPGPAQTVCTAADISLIQQMASNPGTLMPDIEGALYGTNPDCAQCIFSHESDTRWGPLVYYGNAGDVFVNWGACFATAPGGSDACGAAFQKAHDCSLDVCSGCTSDSTLSSCYSTSFSNPETCGQYKPTGTCGASYATIDQACLDVFSVIRVVCGG
jgi:hypothetical protein